jgi:fatty-acyl-CoA synthase
MHAGLPPDQQRAVKLKQGRGVWGVELKIVDEVGRALPWDGKAYGHLHVRGPWIASGYFKGEGGDKLDPEGFFPTGDVATIDPDGYVQLVDRAKDVIKSGGEWISSIDLENAATSYPSVAEAAVVGVPHPKWDERPLLLVVATPGRTVDRAALLTHLTDKVAKWWLPDDVVVDDELPHTATGKLLKTALREQYRNHTLPGDTSRP